MTLSLSFETGNAAFENQGEIGSVLRTVAKWIDAGRLQGGILDSNGARVGEYTYVRQPRAEIAEARARVRLGETSSGSLKMNDIVAGIRYLLPEGMLEEFEMYDLEDPDDEDSVTGIFDEICEYLNEIAPVGVEFGASEGDGASFGFWSIEEE